MKNKFNLRKPDGQWLSSSFDYDPRYAAKLALEFYLTAQGKPFSEDRLTVEPMDDKTFQVTHDGEEYLLERTEETSNTN